MNWWLITYLAILIFSSSITAVKCETVPDRVDVLIGFIITVWLMYIVATLLFFYEQL